MLTKIALAFEVDISDDDFKTLNALSRDDLAEYFKIIFKLNENVAVKVDRFERENT